MDDIEQVTGPISAHGESPVWCDAWGGLRWVDMAGGDVLALEPSGEVRRWHVGHAVAAIRPRAGGGTEDGTESGMVLALRRRFALADEWGGELQLTDELWPDSDLRFNDGACDPDGTFWCASMPDDYGPGRGTMYRLAPDGSVRAMFDGIGVSNGLDWTADGRTAYHADTLACTIDRYDYDPERGLSGRVEFVRVAKGGGMPDGLTVDSEGYVWTALWNGGAVHRYAPDGRLDAVLEFPVRRVTACTFGGPDRTELYVTSIGEPCEPHERGAAGAVFRVRTGVRGQAVRTFAG
jgi:sugar lactone lactonase YvrE